VDSGPAPSGASRNDENRVTGRPFEAARYLLDLRFLADFFFEVFFLEVFFGTFCPSALASERPIAIACLRLLTFLPDLPLFKVPVLRFFIARPTLADAFFEYLRAMIILPVAGKQSSRMKMVPAPHPAS
jgi:hypothetical protein